MQFFVPKVIFSAEGQKLYMEEYLQPYKWTHLSDIVEISENLKQQAGNFRTRDEISKPRHVFLFMINTENINDQTKNPFIYNTFEFPNLPNKNLTLNRYYLAVGNGNGYPTLHYKPTEDMARIFRDVMSYVYANNDFQGGTMLNRTNFESLFPFIYFDLTKQKLDIKDGATKLVFHYEISGKKNNYNIYALILYEREAELQQKDEKLLLRG